MKLNLLVTMVLVWMPLGCKKAGSFLGINPQGSAASDGESRSKSKSSEKDKNINKTDSSEDEKSKKKKKRKSVKRSSKDVEKANATNLLFKRHRAIANDLKRGLELTDAELCMELGISSCTDEVHLASLGGNDPFKSGTYVRPVDPSAITSLSLDRVILSACTNRYQLDQDSGTASSLFAGFTSVNDDGVKKLSEELYRRLLLRDPTAKEIETILKFTADQSDPAVVAKSLCYAIGTSVEFMFY